MTRWYTDVLNGQHLAVIDGIVSEEAAHTPPTFTEFTNREGARGIVSTLLASYPTSKTPSRRRSPRVTW